MKVLITRTDGGVSVMTTSGDINAELAKWKSIHGAQYVSHREATGDIPSDRTFRNAWKPDLSVDMGKAREIQRDRLRALRTPLMAKADIAFMLALESDDKAKQAEIRAYKQALRDVTADPMIDAAQTPEALKMAIPEILRG